MKKIYFIAVMLSAITTQSFAQVAGAHFGIQVGGNLAYTHLKLQSSTNSDNKVDLDPRLGWVAGLVSEFQLGPVSLRPELNWVQKGFKANNSRTIFGIDATTDNKMVLNYIELPLNVTFNVPSGSSHLFLGLGPVFSLGLNGKYKNTSSVGGLSAANNSDVKFDGDENATDNDTHLKRFDFGADAIVGYKLAAGFTLAVSYTLGISNILPDNANNNGSGTSNNNDNSWRNSGLALKVGYMFGGSKNISGGSHSTGAASSSSSSSNF